MKTQDQPQGAAMSRPIYRRDSRLGFPPPKPGPTLVKSLGAIRAPYNFVPLADWVYFPPWSDAASHDLPFLDGIGGTLEFTLVADSPVLVSREGDFGEKRFIQAPDGRYVIPGSSLRGMVRNVLEIATFGKMGLIDDRHLGVRDLSGGLPAYAKGMTERVGRAYRARAETGWLRFEDGGWRIYPCRHSRVEHDDLAALLRSEQARQFKGFVQGKLDDAQRSAHAKYRKWIDLGGFLDIRFEPGPVRDHPHSRGNLLRYSKATEVGRGSKLGRLVLTGQPSPRKHMEFLFYDTAATPLEPDRKVMRGFLKIHEDSKDWETWRNRHWHLGESIPVFYLADNGKIASLGLAQMFKLPCRLSIRDALRNSSPEHCDRGRPDFVETLFGHAVSGGEQRKGMKSRVSFGAAFSADARLGEPATVILNSPKPSYYPNYIRQSTDKSGDRLAGDSRGYTTLMDEQAQLRGWKRYPGKPFSPLRSVQPSKVSSTLHPLAAGATFAGKLRFHNLKPEELGALAWALTWGGDRNLAHQLGMGKPLGYGMVRIKLGRVDLRSNDPATPAVDGASLLLRCISAFRECMERACCDRGLSDGWQNSKQLVALLTMANPQIGEDRELTDMVLDHQSRRNDFVEAKKRENYFVLGEYEP
jgi:CRISPR-associated protein (TIGR03986 family)